MRVFIDGQQIKHFALSKTKLCLLVTPVKDAVVRVETMSDVFEWKADGQTSEFLYAAKEKMVARG